MDKIVSTKKMVFGGSCIAEIDGKTVFIPFSLPNEKLKISVIKEYKAYSKAIIKEIIEPSPKRVTPKCKYFQTCGGCSLQMADGEYQKILRQNAALEPLYSQGIDLETEFISGALWEYRNRFQFHTDTNGRAGLKEGAGSRTIFIDDCPVAVPEIRRLLQSGKPLTQNLCGRIQCFAANGKIHTQDSICSIKINNKIIKFNSLGFFQSNLQMLEKLIDLIFEDGLSCGRFLDLYAGVGTFSVFAADTASQLCLIEHNRYAIEFAKQNIEAVFKKTEKKIPVFYCKGSGEKWFNDNIPFVPDFAVVDPPRTGIEKKVLNRLCTLNIKKIAYVSCNPVTFARDTKVLIESGYSLIKHYLLDFYPQTHHIETLGIFKR